MVSTRIVSVIGLLTTVKNFYCAGEPGDGRWGIVHPAIAASRYSD